MKFFRVLKVVAFLLLLPSAMAAQKQEFQPRLSVHAIADPAKRWPICFGLGVRYHASWLWVEPNFTHYRTRAYIWHTPFTNEEKYKVVRNRISLDVGGSTRPLLGPLRIIGGGRLEHLESFTKYDGTTDHGSYQSNTGLGIWAGLRFAPSTSRLQCELRGYTSLFWETEPVIPYPLIAPRRLLLVRYGLEARLGWTIAVKKK